MCKPDQPGAAQKGPFAITMKPGRYWWCACGKSAAQPFCDKAHKGSAFSPIKVEITEEKEVHWCGCQQSGNKPYCDGSHKKL